MFRHLGLNHPDIGQAACGHLLSLLSALHLQYSFCHTVKSVGRIQKSNGRGTILITQGQTSCVFKRGLRLVFCGVERNAVIVLPGIISTRLNMGFPPLIE